jgi:Ferritin-like
MIALRASLGENLDTAKGARTALQQAIELEHATIPAYLYALYSLVPGRNEAIAELVRSVVIEEMSHMALAANVLNAIDGKPVIDHPKFVPSYPGPLPGSVESGLVVPLKPFSLKLVEHVFMVIEEPEHPHKYPAATAAAEAPLTIGRFYRAISDRLEEGMFTGHPSRQVTLDFGSVQVVPVTNVDGARAAIEDIVEQGEGTATSPLDEERELAHYYRFAEIAKGHALVPDPQSGFSYTGDPIAFDPDGVAPLVANPNLAGYPVASQAHRRCATFNYTYTSLLRTLHAAFNGKPDRIDAAIGLMESLKVQALDMANGPRLPDGSAPGPSFEYQPENPA